MTTCKSCDGVVVDDNYQKICSSCGVVQDVGWYVDIKMNSNNDGTKFAYFENTTEYVKASKSLKYHFAMACSQINGIPHTVVTEVETLWPKLYKVIKRARSPSKNLYLYALFFIIYRNQVDVALSVKQFCRACSFEMFTFRHLLFVQQCLNLPYIEKNVKNNLLATIKETVALALKKKDLKKEVKILEVAQRLGVTILEQGWYNLSSTAFVPSVAGASVYFASEYVERLYQDKKMKGNHWINTKIVAKYLCISTFILYKAVSYIRESLFNAALKLPIQLPPKVKNEQDVCYIIPEIYEYLEYYKDDSDDDDNFKFTIVPFEVKQCIVKSLDCLFKQNNKLRMSLHGLQTAEESQSNYAIDHARLTFFLDQELLKIYDYKNQKNFISFTNSGYLIINEHTISMEILEMIKTLLKAGCPVDELCNKEYITLIKLYLEQKVDDDNELSELSDEEALIYIKTEAERNISLDDIIQGPVKSGENLDEKIIAF